MHNQIDSMDQEETKGIKTYQIKKEDKPEVVEEFLDFLNQ